MLRIGLPFVRVRVMVMVTAALKEVLCCPNALVFMCHFYAFGAVGLVLGWHLPVNIVYLIP